MDAMVRDTRFAYRDLREWIAALEAEAQLTRVTAEVDWKYELGAVVRKTWDTYGDASPALLFTSIKGYPAPGPSKLFTGAFRSWYRAAMMLGLDPKTATRNQILRTLKDRITDKSQHIPPRWVKSGPVKENIIKGDDVDLGIFPTPHWNERDGGRLLGSFGSVFTKDRDTGWVNVGVYRLMMHSRNELGIQLDPANQHIGEHYFKKIQDNEPMEVAVAIGHEPALSFMACIPTVEKVSELDIAGAIRGAPIDVVKAETVDLPVPANAEIVIEGTIHPKERKMEGPLGEYPGYYGSVAGPKPVLRVKCITHRNDPIFRGTLEGHPVNEDHMTLALGHAAYAWDILERNSIKGVIDVAMPLDSCGYATCVVSIKPLMEAHPDVVACALWGSKPIVWAYKHVIVVDEDIDPWNSEMVNWSIAWRTRASEDIKIWKNHKGSRLDPRIPPEEKGFQDRVLIDATRPYHWAPRQVWSTEPEGRGLPLKFPPSTRPATETCLRVNGRWDQLDIHPTRHYIGSPEGMMRHWWRDEEIRKVLEHKVMP
jgi:4-hydroxy-3-polyprenylbenzoate decarboxylase